MNAGAAPPVAACAFCREVATPGKALGELRTVVALRDLYPVADGHVIVVPRRHVVDFFDLTDDESRDTFALIKLMRDYLIGVDPTIRGFNVGVNAGEAAGQTVEHVHVHLIPRRIGDIDDPRGGVRGVIPDRRDY